MVGPLSVRTGGWGTVAARGLLAAAALAVLAHTASAQAEPAQKGLAPPRRPAERAVPTVDILIPFTVGGPSCTDRSHPHVVSIRIYNVLAQLVAVPLLRADQSAEPPPPGLVGRPLNKLLLPCGRYLAYWNGRQAMSGRPLPAGVYLYELVVDDQRIAGKLTIGK